MRCNLKVLATISFFFSVHFTFSQQLNEKLLSEHLEYLASDSLKGRESGTTENLLARDYVASQFKEMGLDSQYFDYLQEFRFNNRRSKGSITGFNVISFLPGTESNKIIVVTAHFDHVGVGRPDASGDSIYNGSDDNASGTAALIEMARYFSSNPPKHSMIFAALDAEEMGLQGAKALVEDFPFDLNQILININMDMISRNDAGEIYVSGTHHNPDFKSILEESALGKSPQLKFGHDIPGSGPDDWTKSSDHAAFFAKKIPHLYFGVEDHADYHRPSDEVRPQDKQFFVDAASLILDCIINIDANSLNH